MTNDSARYNYDRIEAAIRYLEENFRRQPQLEEVAEQVNVSPFHFQKMFSDWAGISPKRFLQYLTIDFLKDKLKSSQSLMEAAELAGLSSQSRVYDLFTTLEAVTPEEHKRNGAGIRIDYGFHFTLFGECLIGVTGRGVCWLSFVPADGDKNAALEEMKRYWHNALFHEDHSLTHHFIDRIFETKRPVEKLHVLVKGTNFQVKVWEALLRLPMGEVTTYQEIARTIGNPKAVQAVGSAVGANHVAFLIPCHRVIRKDGILGEYRWSSTRKKGILGWEMARAENG